MALAAGLTVRGLQEPLWPRLDGHGGPAAQALCPRAAADAYTSTPAAVVGEFAR
ncbi:hypothetical protein ACPPVO_40860 [Dactylosporangium sp. McL0621]|uniref:hypothetical protein n=1 Tax=Dactylosporangium sp. McL0621 TaxID=3415678 RepID=UPI003CF4A13E